jgi:hypothetical protein
VGENVEEEREWGQEERNRNSISCSDGNSSDYNNHNDDTDQDSDEGLRHAKRRRLSSSNNNPTSKQNWPRDELNNTASSASTALKSTNLAGPQLNDLLTDTDQEWEIRSIIGRQKVDGVVQYWVEWEPTWMPESELGGAMELVDEFEAQLQALCENQNRQEEADAIGETKPKRRRGRPPKKSKTGCRQL